LVFFIDDFSDIPTFLLDSIPPADIVELDENNLG
jgi:hypothetical protein